MGAGLCSFFRALAPPRKTAAPEPTAFAKGKVKREQENSKDGRAAVGAVQAVPETVEDAVVRGGSGVTRSRG
eukprot:CAMPEP_0201487884 /NCGR_PEP_ID=MMETSP0151_2-20130828/16097_1 /ASSEMBLY_ACC=CAM_ASM_000257 /TAXON_ID=200890 /ORGANISM="Paramoeba atlantica, Strain 621/1 / CCAP 1560/9" /LENGTH=71 /DNA_ID=CAMNT_0047873053 /DNA_START=354 /DNA_END=569 /DNA_ORIENTATION=-